MTYFSAPGCAPQLKDNFPVPPKYVLYGGLTSPGKMHCPSISANDVDVAVAVFVGVLVLVAVLVIVAVAELVGVNVAVAVAVASGGGGASLSSPQLHANAPEKLTINNTKLRNKYFQTIVNFDIIAPPTILFSFWKWLSVL